MDKIEVKILNCSAIKEAEKNMVFAAKLESAISKLSLTMEQVEYYFRLFSPN